MRFSDYAGADLLLHITGEYSKPDPASGYRGGFDISTVCLDGCEADISSLISLPIIETLEYRGIKVALTKGD